MTLELGGNLKEVLGWAMLLVGYIIILYLTASR